MKSIRLIRFSGSAVMVSSVAYVSLGLVARVGWWAGRLNLPEAIQGGYYRFEPLFLLGVMAALAVLHLLQRERYAAFYGPLAHPRAGRWMGTLVFLLAFVGVALMFVDASSSLVHPGAMAPFWLSFTALLVATVGITGYGVQTMSTKVMPWWCGAALVVGSPASSFVFYLFGELEWLLGVPWALVGYTILRTARRQSEQPSRVRR